MACLGDFSWFATGFLPHSCAAVPSRVVGAEGACGGFRGSPVLQANGMRL